MTPQPSNQDKTSHGAMPKTVTGAAFAFLALFVMHRGEVADTYKRLYPKLPQSRIDAMVNNLLLSGIIPHIIFVILLLWFSRPSRTYFAIRRHRAS